MLYKWHASYCMLHLPNSSIHCWQISLDNKPDNAVSFFKFRWRKICPIQKKDGSPSIKILHFYGNIKNRRPCFRNRLLYAVYEQMTSSTNVLMCDFSVILSLGIKMLLFCCYILNVINIISYIEQNSD